MSAVCLAKQVKKRKQRLTDCGGVLRSVQRADDDKAEAFGLLAVDDYIGGGWQVDWTHGSASGRAALIGCRSVLSTGLACRGQQSQSESPLNIGFSLPNT